MLRNLRELWQYRALLVTMTQRELKARYRASVLGFLWTFLNPTLNMAVYAFVFSVILKQRQPAYPHFLFVALLPWIYFSSSIGSGTSAVSDRRDLLTKVRFPAQVLPATIVASNLVNYLLSLPLLLILGALYGVFPSWHVVFLLPLILLQTWFTLGLTYLLSAFNVALRDLQHIVGNLLLMGFFLTPVVWAVPPESAEWTNRLAYSNPMAALVFAHRDIFVKHQIPQWEPLAAVAGISFLVFWLGTWVFESRREEFAELV